jgi:hypothetical protein
MRKVPIYMYIMFMWTNLLYTDYTSKGNKYVIR